MGANVVKTTAKLEICPKFFMAFQSETSVFEFQKKVNLADVKHRLEFHIFVFVLK